MSEGRLTVLYDGRCRVCTRIAGRLAGLDRDRRLRLVPLQRAAEDRPEVRRLRAEQDLRRALHVIDEEGRWAVAGEAVLRTLERLPRVRPLVRFARLPLVSALVEPGYRLVADHRARLAWLAGGFGATGRHPVSGSGRSRRRPCRRHGPAGSARSHR